MLFFAEELKELQEPLKRDGFAQLSLSLPSEQLDEIHRLFESPPSGRQRKNKEGIMGGLRHLCHMSNKDDAFTRLITALSTHILDALSIQATVQQVVFGVNYFFELSEEEAQRLIPADEGGEQLIRFYDHHDVGIINVIFVDKDFTDGGGLQFRAPGVNTPFTALTPTQNLIQLKQRDQTAGAQATIRLILIAGSELIAHGYPAPIHRVVSLRGARDTRRSLIAVVSGTLNNKKRNQEQRAFEHEMEMSQRRHALGLRASVKEAGGH